MTIEELEALLETVTRERDEARDTIVALTTAKAEADLEIATLTAARAESTKWKAAFENIRRTNTDLMMQLFEAQEKVRAVNIGPVLHENAQLRSKVLGLSAEVERLMHQLADQTNETTRARLEAKREVDMLQDRLSEARAEVDRLTDERDELLVRVAEQGAELRATRESYNEARAECERMKTFAAQNFSAMIRQEAEQ
ncbi:MAG: hypothetical protein ACO32I_09340, partial [Candidatus Limnocylindrus sp.]